MLKNMRKTIDLRLEEGRVRSGYYASDSTYGNTGAFFIQGPKGARLKIIASDAKLPDSHGWEHVSVSCENRTPNWTEMCFVKDLFWAPEECVIQFHPPKNDYVNCHPFCLHLWRYVKQEFPMPPSILVGPKE